MRVVMDEREMAFDTDERLFSPGAPDRGTLAMLRAACIEPGQRVLDLGCGWGLVGVYAALTAGEQNVVMLDKDPLAVKMAAHNAKMNGVGGVCVLVSDGFSALNETGFDVILSNPPYHTDFSIAKLFIEKGFNRLKVGGTMWMVTKRKPWYQNKLTAIFGGVRVREDDGYYVFEAQKRDYRYANHPARQDR